MGGVVVWLCWAILGVGLGLIFFLVFFCVFQEDEGVVGDV
jgi:hypothetical protein